MATMARLTLLITLLGASAAMDMFADQTGQLQRILDSPVVQLLAERLDLQLPEVPELDVDIQNIDVNALAEKASSIGCLPEGVQFPDEVRDTLRDCTRQAYGVATALPVRRRGTGRRRGSGKRRLGRSLIDRVKKEAIARFTAAMQQCSLTSLSLLDDAGGLNQTAVDALIDSITADDDFKAEKKNATQACIAAAPEDLSSRDKLQFQVRCIGNMNSLACGLRVADGVSPTVGFLARLKAGKCLKSLQPPARATMAKTACVAEEISTLMRARLDETAPARRRRDADLMTALQKIGGLQGLERAIGAAPPAKPCRPSWRRKCPPPTKPAITAEKVNETLARAEGVLGPLDEWFSSLPERADSAATCWHTTMGTLSEDGSVDVDALQAVLAEYSGPPELTDALADIVSTCDEMGAASSVEAFTDCFTNAAPYVCDLNTALQGRQQAPARG